MAKDWLKGRRSFGFTPIPPWLNEEAVMQDVVRQTVHCNVLYCIVLHLIQELIFRHADIYFKCMVMKLDTRMIDSALACHVHHFQ